MISSEVRHRLCNLALCTLEGVWGPCAVRVPHHGVPTLSVATELRHDETSIPCPYSQSISEMVSTTFSPVC
jgi:hypothetical protein